MQLDDLDRTILKLYAEGKRAREIADLVYLSPRTVEKRLENAKRKNKCRTTFELVAKYVTFVL